MGAAPLRYDDTGQFSLEAVKNGLFYLPTDVVQKFIEVTVIPLGAVSSDQVRTSPRSGSMAWAA